MVEALCMLVEEQAKVIRYLSMELAHARNLSESEKRTLESVNSEYAEIIGSENA
jgi:hypothetical protein|nr:MAG TPA: hypothetical protein [Caudoviricetes sp.]